jgi:hypothetical protein
MTDVLVPVVLTLLAAWLVWWLFLTPASPPRPHRRRLDGIGWSACALAVCLDGVRLTVDLESGARVCELEKRPDTGVLEQDLLLHIPCPDAPDVARQIVDALRAAGYGATTQAYHDEADQRRECEIQVSLFGRREELGFHAIAALRALASATSLPRDTIYVLQQCGFHDPRLVRRYAEEDDQSADAKRKLSELTELAQAAAA